MKLKELSEKTYPYRRALVSCWRKIPKKPEQIYQGTFGVPVFANGIPKCGTHLLQSTINELSSFRFRKFCEFFNNADEVILQRRGEVLKKLTETGKGFYYFGHLEPEPDILDVLKEKGFRTLLIIRDPRDLVCSHIFHAQKDKYRFCNHYKHTLTSDEDRIMASIVGLPAKFAEGSSEPLWDIFIFYAVVEAGH